MSLRFHCHVPKLLDFALYSACDDIVKHGKQGLPKPMPRPLYYRCIMSFAEKYDSQMMSQKKLFDICRLNECAMHQDIVDNWRDSVVYSTSRDIVVISLWDHVIIDINDNMLKLIDLIVICDDVDEVIKCIHRFAARCMRTEVMVMMMSHALGKSPCKSIRDVLIGYGGTLLSSSEHYLELACRNGMNDLLSNSIESGSIIKYSLQNMAIISGDIGTVELIMRVVSDVSLPSSSLIDVQSFTVDYCNLLLSLGVIKRNERYGLLRIPSLTVYKWFHSNDMIVIPTVCDVAERAAGGNRVYSDILHYLIEEENVEISPDFFNRLYGHRGYDLNMLDFVAFHFKITDDLFDNNPVMCTPLLFRYWIDNDMFDESVCRYVTRCCIECRVPTAIIETLMSNYNISVNSSDVSLLHCALRAHHIDVVELLCSTGVSWHILPRVLDCVRHDDVMMHILQRYGCNASA